MAESARGQSTRVALHSQAPRRTLHGDQRISGHELGDMKRTIFFLCGGGVDRFPIGICHEWVFRRHEKRTITEAVKFAAAECHPFDFGNNIAKRRKRGQPHWRQPIVHVE